MEKISTSDCFYADKGCSYHAICTKNNDEIKECGYYKYFVYLDEAFPNKGTELCEDRPQND